MGESCRLHRDHDEVPLRQRQRRALPRALLRQQGELAGLQAAAGEDKKITR